MKYSAVLSALGSATVVLGHGLVSQIEIGGTLYDNYSPYVDPYLNPAVERIGWTTESNGPVEDVSTAGIACNTGSTAGALSATTAAGSDVKFFWTVWPESHKGPTMTYLAKCPGTDCTTADPTTLDWFKIDEAGLNSDGTWASDTLIANNNTWTVTIPSDIASGPYLMRHELLALHAAENTNGAQFYPMCANLIVTGSGSAVPSDTVKFPGGYTSSDPGILINIYYPVPTSYTIPGPAVYVPGGASASTSVAATTSAAAATSVAATEIAATSEVAATSVAETTSVAAIPTTVLASSTFIGTGFVGTGPASLPTYVPSVRPPFSNSTRTITRSRGPTSSALLDATHTVSVLPVQETDPVDFTTEIVYVTAPATTSAPATTVTETQTSTVEKTVILTFTASAIETVTVTERRPECTATGRHRRGTYFV